jgi:uncharacterized protein YegL
MIAIREIIKTITNNNLKFFKPVRIIVLGFSSTVDKLKDNETRKEIKIKRTNITIKLSIGSQGSL